MAARDAFLKRIIFNKNYGAIAQFAKNPDLHTVTVSGYVIPKTYLFWFLQSHLPGYRKFRINQQDEFFKSLYDNLLQDPNLKRFSDPNQETFSNDFTEGFSRVLGLPDEQKEAQMQKLLQEHTPEKMPKELLDAQKPPGDKSENQIPHYNSQNPKEETAFRQTPQETPEPLEEEKQAPKHEEQETPKTQNQKPEEPDPNLQPKPSISTPPPVSPTPVISTQPKISLNQRIQNFKFQISTLKSKIPYPVKNFTKNALSTGLIKTKSFILKNSSFFIPAATGGIAAVTTFFATGNPLVSFVAGSGGFLGTQLFMKNIATPPTPSVPTPSPAATFSPQTTFSPNFTSQPRWTQFKTRFGSWFKGGGGIGKGRGGILSSGGGGMSSNPYTKKLALLAVGSFLMLLIGVGVFSVFFGGGSGTTNPSSNQNQNKVTVVKSGSATVVNEGEITYQLAVTFQGTGKADISVIDKLPEQVQFVSASDSGKHTGETNGGTVNWGLTGISSGQTKNLTLVVKALPSASDSYIVNNAEATITQVTGLHTYRPITIEKNADKDQTIVGDSIEYLIKIKATTLISNKVVITDTLPEGTSLIAASESPTQKGNILEWIFDAEKISGSTGGPKPIPPEPQSPPPQYIRPAQRISVTAEQVKSELEKHNSPYAQYYQALYDAGVRHNVDPALILAIWRWESLYGKVGGYPNNPGSIVYVRPGYLGMTDRFIENQYGRWAIFPSIEAGLNAMAELIAVEYYPKGQIDTWTIHSGTGPRHEHAYHGRNHASSWEFYVNFHYKWVDTIDEIAGGNGYGIDKQLTVILRANEDKKWLLNTATVSSGNSGEIKSKGVVVKVGDASEAERPSIGTLVKAPPPNLATIREDIKNKFGITTSDTNTALSYPRKLLWEDKHLTWIWEELWEVSNTNLFSLVQGTTLENNNNEGSSMTWPDKRLVRINPEDNEDHFKYLLLHELGHIVGGNSPYKTYWNTDFDRAYKSEGGISHYARTADTCAPIRNVSTETRRKDEDFAEMIAYYLNSNQKSYYKLCPGDTDSIIPDLKSRYPLHYQVAAKILGGFD